MRRSLGPKTNTPRLACVKPAASVHPEPGSNSSSYIVRIDKSILFFNKRESIGAFLLFFLRSITLSYLLSIQYVYERVFLFVAVSFKLYALGCLAGCKHKMFFRFSQMFFFIFFLSKSSRDKSSSLQ